MEDAPVNVPMNPAAQAMHAVAALGAFAYVPAAHVVHAASGEGMAPPADQDPGEHAMQEVEAGAPTLGTFIKFGDMPAGQGVHAAVCPDAALTEPMAHATHAVADIGALAYVAGGQIVHPLGGAVVQPVRPPGDI